ncbi:MAG: phosphodiester glycosidase family protein [Limnochordia bacterium]|jgi:hypothetical protein
MKSRVSTRLAHKGTPLPLSVAVFIVLLGMCTGIALAQVDTLQGTVLVHAPETRTGAITIRTQVTLPESCEDAVEGIWLAGLAAEPGEAPTALALTWSQIEGGWFGPIWGLQLAGDARLLRGVFPPKRGEEGFLAGTDYVALASRAPEWGHVYEASLGYNPQDGSVSVSVDDLTANRVIISDGYQFEPVTPVQWLPSAGVTYRSGATVADPVSFRIVDILDVHLPAGITIWLTQQDVDGQFRPVDAIDRRETSSLLLRMPWKELAGSLCFVLDDGEQSQQLQTISQPSDDTYYPLDLRHVPTGKFQLTAHYVENDRSWQLVQRDLAVGEISLLLTDLQGRQTPDHSLVITGRLAVASDGPIGSLVSGVAVELTKHDFGMTRGAGSGAIGSEVLEASIVINKQILQINDAGLTELPFEACIALPEDADECVWQVTLRPFVTPETVAVKSRVADLWIGKPARPRAWTGFLEEETARHIPVAPGVDAYQISGQIGAGALQMCMLEVNLTHPGVEANSLVGSQFTAGAAVRFPRSQVSQMVKSTGAVAGVNASFFEISSTMLPLGMLIRSWDLLRSPDPENRGVVGIGDDGRAYIGVWRWRGFVSRPNGTRIQLSRVNTAKLNPNETGLYRAPFLLSPGVQSAGGGGQVTEIVLRKVQPTSPGHLHGVVAEVRRNQPGVYIDADAIVVTGRDGAAEQLAAVDVGEEVEILYTLTGDAKWPGLPATDQLKAAASGGVVLVKNGLYGDPAVHTDANRHPRTVAAVSSDRKTLYLFVVDGRSKASVGMTYKEMADLFLYMGAFEALNLDGGGSSTLVTMPEGSSTPRAINTPSDGQERFVPDGVGVFYRREQN